MTLEIDAVLDRRRMRRKVSFWRAVALIVAFVGVIVGLSSTGAFSGATGYGDHIARVEISGMITDDRKVLSYGDIRLCKKVFRCHES